MILFTLVLNKLYNCHSKKGTYDAYSDLLSCSRFALIIDDMDISESVHVDEAPGLAEVV